MFRVILFILVALSFLLWSIFFILTINMHKKTPKLSKDSFKKSPKTLPLVSVIIPARNEANKIKKCIETLKSQTYPKLEILIVDDSTDNTVEIIKNIVGDDKRFKILKQEKLPIGWIGKTYALQQGSTQANGEWLLFLDADTYYDDELVERAVVYAIENKIDLLSLISHNICESFWEKVIQPVTGELEIFFLWKVNNPKSKFALALGHFVFIRYKVFKKVGGYEAIKGMLADDVNIGKLVKRSGFKIALVNAQSMMKLRMYERFSEMWEGWGKHVFGIIQNPRFNTRTLKTLAILGILFGFFEAFVLPFLAVIISLLLGLLLKLPQWDYLFLFSLVTWLFSIVAQFYAMKRFYIGDPKYAPLTFLGGIVIIGTILNSAYKILSGKGVTWKGRSYNYKDTK